MGAYLKEYLTRKVKNGPWYVQFRIPKHLKGRPPFGDREVFSKSLGTKKLKDACEKRDVFFEQIGFYQLEIELQENERERQQREADKRKGQTEHYWEALTHSLSGRSAEELTGELDEIEIHIGDLAFDAEQKPLSKPEQMRRKKLIAQREAIERAIRELEAEPHKPVEDPHAFDVHMRRAFELYEKRMTRAKKAKKTIGRMWPALERFLAFNGGKDMAFSRVRRPLVYRFIEHSQQQGLARSTVQNDISYFIGAFKHLQETGYISDSLANPFEKHTYSDFEDGGSRNVYTAEQMAKLIKAMDGDQELRAALYVGHYTGMRLEEVFSARIVDVAGITAFSVAENGKGKTKAATRIVPVHSKLKKALSQLGYKLKVGERLAWETSTSDALGKRFGRVKKVVMESEGILDHANRFTFHSLRHGFASNLNEAGFPELHIADLTGHSKGSSSRTEAGKTYIKGLPIERLAAMVETVPALPEPKTIL